MGSDRWDGPPGGGGNFSLRLLAWFALIGNVSDTVIVARALIYAKTRTVVSFLSGGCLLYISLSLPLASISAMTQHA